MAHTASKLSSSKGRSQMSASINDTLFPVNCSLHNSIALCEKSTAVTEEAVFNRAGRFFPLPHPSSKISDPGGKGFSYSGGPFQTGSDLAYSSSQASNVTASHPRIS